MPHPEQPSYAELAARVAELLAVVAEQAALIESLRAEVAALRRQAGRDSSDSSLPSSQDSPAVYRYPGDTYATGPESRVWTRQAGDALREAAAAVRTARAAGQDGLDPALLARLRHSYGQAVAYGISVNLSRPWHKGKHPGLVLARRLKRKASQVWLFPPASTSPPRATDARTPSAAASSPRKSAAAGAPSRPSSATAASAPASPPPGATATTRSPPSATPSPAAPGCHHNQHDQLTRHP